MSVRDKYDTFIELMIDRKHQAKRLGTSIDDFLRQYPQLKQALRLFDISKDQYQKSTEGYEFYSSNSTNDGSQLKGGQKDD